MIRIFSLLFLAAILNICCNANKKKVQSENQDKPAAVFFPVTSYLKGQIIALGKSEVTPLKITSVHKHIDSAWIKIEDIPAIAEPFLHPTIDSASLAKFYKENSFLDQTINAITLSYDPVAYQHDPLALKSLVVYIDPRTHNVTRIYLEKEILSGKDANLQQLTWKADKWFKITTITEHEGVQPEIKEEKVIWNFDEE
jgi:hypothetical protein